jgi:hypothetical protein
MQEKIRELIMIPSNSLDGVIKDIQCDLEMPKNAEIKFHYIQLQGGNVRINDFLSVLQKGLIPYALPREEAKTTTYLTAPQKIAEAREEYVRSANSGELGELSLYMFLESKEEAPQILSKMSLKTSGNMHFHGSDAVHMKINDNGSIILYLGESKAHKTLNKSIKACLKSIGDFYFDELVDGRTQFDFDLKLVKQNMDVKDEELREFLQKLLNPWEGGKENLYYVNACFIPFEIPQLNELDKHNAQEAQGQLNKLYETCMQEIVQELTKLLEKSNNKGLLFHFFFVPFPDIDAVKSSFRKMLGFQGDNNG